MSEGAPGLDLFLSYSRLDQRLVEPLARALAERKLEVCKDDWYLRPGEFWSAALERRLADCAAVVVAIGRHGLGTWQQREIAAALDRQGKASQAGQPEPPVIPVLLERGSEQQAGLAFLLQNVWVEGWDPRAADLIAGALRGKAPAELYDETRPDPRSLVCPYRGLGVFREEDAAFYFGREPDLQNVITAIDRHRIVGIVGPSGSGKSSLARAGLIPHLRRQAGPEVWQVASMVPGSDPFLALARALLPLREPERVLTWSKGDIDDECERLSGRLARDGAAHLSHVLGQILEEEPGTTDLLLLVDQWEELYTYRPTGAKAAEDHGEQVRRFVSMLVGADRPIEPGHPGSLHVMLTLRADFWGNVLNDESLAARLPDDAIVHLRALDRAALEAVIRRPAERTGLDVPDGLVETLLGEIAGQPGDLPLLEFALQRLWAERHQAANALTADAYRAMGGLREAIVSQAEAVYTNMGSEEQNAVPGVFAALIQVGEERSDLRRRARLSRLSEAGRAVVRRFANERLLVTSRDFASGEDLVEVAHEALLRHWPRLEGWIGARRDALVTVRQLQADTRTWLSRGRNPGYLWSHERAAEMARALEKLGSEVVLGEDERTFLGPIDPAAMQSELDRPETTHRRRAFIGERLAALGDPRPGVDVDADGTPEIDWCQVDGGEVEIEDEQRSKRRVERFHIARYPITVAQYRAFLDAEDGWRDPGWWEDDLHRDPEDDSFDVGRFTNDPAVYVSWFDAAAFCRWLTRRRGDTVRLPDEFEWQQAATWVDEAARGDDAVRAFPWGRDWDLKQEPHRANTFESRLGRVTAVGMYPDGASPAGVMDLSGTVWEWCLSKHDDPESKQSRRDDFDPRVLRGGSWGSGRVGARAASRGGGAPGGRNGFIGFRVLCSSPSLGSGS